MINPLRPMVLYVIETSTNKNPVISPLSAAIRISLIKYAVASFVERLFSIIVLSFQ